MARFGKPRKSSLLECAINMSCDRRSTTRVARDRNLRSSLSSARSGARLSAMCAADRLGPRHARKIMTRVHKVFLSIGLAALLAGGSVAILPQLLCRRSGRLLARRLHQRRARVPRSSPARESLGAAGGLTLPLGDRFSAERLRPGQHRQRTALAPSTR
jgi:hypothetical protein